VIRSDETHTDHLSPQYILESDVVSLPDAAAPQPQPLMVPLTLIHGADSKGAAPLPPPLDPISDPNGPYYVHSSDGPSSVKVTPVLNGSNYHSWELSNSNSSFSTVQFRFRLIRSILLFVHGIAAICSSIAGS
ncbi:hypothetical protein L195_g012017, partial [Trifolium pratense]